MIAHRLSTIKNANQILYIDKGEIIERGSHKKLIKACGQYKKMWDLHMDAANWGIQQSNNSTQNDRKEEILC